MRSLVTSIRFISVLSLVTFVCGCSWVGNIVKSEFSGYAEPTDGPLSHVRLIGSRDVKVYPASTCVGVGVVGGGYPAGPQLGGQRKRDLGMPKLTGTPRHFVEIAARPGEPLTMAFSFYRPSTPGKISSHCDVARSFVPEVDGQYEAVARWVGRRCSIDIVQLADDGADGSWKTAAVPSSPAPACSSAVPARAKGAGAPGNGSG